ncbi:LOW QUALITY PROTEIN: hypothetical protein MC885_007476, partial [Smutsia gigantea]
TGSLGDHKSRVSVLCARGARIPHRVPGRTWAREGGGEVAVGRGGGAVRRLPRSHSPGLRKARVQCSRLGLGVGAGGGGAAQRDPGWKPPRAPRPSRGAGLRLLAAREDTSPSAAEGAQGGPRGQRAAAGDVTASEEGPRHGPNAAHVQGPGQGLSPGAARCVRRQGPPTEAPPVPVSPSRDWRGDAGPPGPILKRGVGRRPASPRASPQCQGQKKQSSRGLLRGRCPGGLFGSPAPRLAKAMASKLLRAVILGPPGSGKGTVCQRIAQNFGLQHLSSGHFLRENIKANTGEGVRGRGAGVS